jgi:hypothetical protein
MMRRTSRSHHHLHRWLWQLLLAWQVVLCNPHLGRCKLSTAHHKSGVALAAKLVQLEQICVRVSPKAVTIVRLQSSEDLAANAFASRIGSPEFILGKWRLQNQTLGKVINQLILLCGLIYSELRALPALIDQETLPNAMSSQDYVQYLHPCCIACVASSSYSDCPRIVFRASVLCQMQNMMFVRQFCMEHDRRH